MNTPGLESRRLILRRFTENDMGAFYRIFSDLEINKFLPWFPVETIEDARRFYERHWEEKYRQERAYQYAVCMREDDVPVGYVSVGTEPGYDLGYGLLKDYWHKGIITEACGMVLGRLREDGVPYVTATHDVNNPRSGAVMRRLGMRYCYSYEEQWQPKDFPVIFRMYQINLDGNGDRIYRKYWDQSKVHFIEMDI